MVAEVIKQPIKQPMTIPLVMQGLIETGDGKVFELDSPKGAAWLETIGSFRYEPTGDGKPYTVRKEASAYWYGCRKIEGKVRKKYIGKSSEVSVAKLEEIAEALEISAEPRAKQVAERVAEVAQFPPVVEVVAESRVTALELQVAELLEAVKALQEALPRKSESVDNAVAEQLHNSLGNSQEMEILKAENEDLKRLLAKKLPLVSGDLWQQIDNLKERNRQLRLKMGEERRESIEKISELERLTENQMRRNQEKQARIDELEIQVDSSNNIKEELREEIRELRSQLATERTDRDEIETQLAELKQKSAAARDLPDAVDLTKKAGELLNLFKSLLPKNTKLPNGTISKIEKILEGGSDD